MKIFTCFLLLFTAVFAPQFSLSVCSQSVLPIVGRVVKPDGAEKEVDVSFTTEEIVAAMEGDREQKFYKGPVNWARILVHLLAAPGPVPPTSVEDFSQKQAYRRVQGEFRVTYNPFFSKDLKKNEQIWRLVGQLTEVTANANLTPVNVNRPEKEIERLKVLRLNDAAITAKIFNIILTEYPGNLEEAIFTSRVDPGKAIYVFNATSMPMPFFNIKMSAYEKWVSEQVSAMKLKPASEKRKYGRFLNRMLLERMYSEKATFATKVVGDDFLKGFINTKN